MKARSLYDIAAEFSHNANGGGNSFLDKLEITTENPRKPRPLCEIKDALNAAKAIKEQKNGFDTAANLRSRANSKHLTQTLAAGLLQLSQPHNAKAYANTYFCASFVVENNGKMQSKYCKNRWCLVCNRIKTAYLIDKYNPFINEWQDKHFVTLTAPNVKRKDLSAQIALYLDVFAKIQDRMRKQGQKIKGIRKLECTYNPDRNDYHPHLHIIVESKHHAEKIRSYWLESFQNANIAAQDIQAASPETIKELFKYFTKITSDSKNSETITLPALDAIFEAVKGRRVFQNFGFVAKVTEVLTDEIMQAYSDKLAGLRANESALKYRDAFNTYLPAGANTNTPAAAIDKLQLQTNQAYIWNQHIGNWIDSGELLSDYQVTGRAKDFKNLLIFEFNENKNAKLHQIKDYQPNVKRNANPNGRKFELRSEMAKRRTESEKDFLLIESLDNVQTRPA